MCAVINVSEAESDNSLVLPHPETEAEVPVKWSASEEEVSGRQTGLMLLSNCTADSRISMATSW